MKSQRIAPLLLTLLLTVSGAQAASRKPVTRGEAVPSEDQLKLQFPGKNPPIPYEQYGSFEGLGTTNYKYVITEKKALADAAGEGVFPNNQALQSDDFKAMKKSGALDGNQWKYVDGNTAAKNFYKWASTNDDPGVKQFYVAMMLERAGQLTQAIKAFYAIAVHFPKTVSYTYYDTPWYVAPVCLDRVEQLLRRHPKLNLKLEGARIAIEGKYDTNQKNDVFHINPGKLSVGRAKDKVNLSKLKVVKTIGQGHTELKKYENGHWQFFVDGKPFEIKAVTYSIAPVGVSPDRGTWDVSRDWQLVDLNKNGKHDGFDEAFVDKNENGVRDANEPVVGDGQLLEDMGANTLRAYHHVYNKELFRRLYKEHGLHILCGDLLGAYTVGSGAKWQDGTDYANPTQRATMLEGVRKMVMEMKDEPYVIMWVLGNENVYGVANNANTKPEAFFTLINEAAELIHQLDPTRAVAISNGDLLNIEYIKKYCPAVDVMGANAYRGEQGFGRHMFQDVKDALDRPLIITEFGVSAYAEPPYTRAQAEAYQAMYLANNWEDLQAHMAGKGVGNVLGGVLFEFIDEWWKANSDLPEKVQKQRAEWYASKSATYKSLQPENHDNVPQFGFPFLDGWSYEEWYGLISQGNGKASPYGRIIRPAYYRMKAIWKK